jgi:hypothetical protein
LEVVRVHRVIHICSMKSMRAQIFIAGFHAAPAARVSGVTNSWLAIASKWQLPSMAPQGNRHPCKRPSSQDAFCPLGEE